MADAGAQRSCCIKNQWRLRNAEKTLEALEDIYQKSEGEIRKLQVRGFAINTTNYFAPIS